MESDNSRKQTVASPLKVALIGYGKMGKAFEAALQERGHDIVNIIDPKEIVTPISNKTLDAADVCIDFSTPSSAINNIRQIAEAGKSVVVGTTGWYDGMDDVAALVKKYQIGLLYAPNFSIGVHLFLTLVAEAALLFDPFAEYDVAGYEAHHRQKIDTPSGTAREIGRRLIHNMQRKNKIVFGDEARSGDGDEIHFPSLRCGSIPGTHSVIFDSPADTIELTHTARSRDGFARGAVVAAEWLCGRKGIFTLDDMLMNQRG